MLFTINNIIKFRNNDGALWIENIPDSEIILTITTSRLLNLLLSRNGQLITRDEILTKVWDAYGLKSSNNSLNKYISDLRKVFRDMGQSEEIIVTVPKTGFTFSATVHEEKITHLPLCSRSEETRSAFLTFLGKRDYAVLKKTLFTLIILLIWAVLFVKLWYSREQQEIENSPIGSIIYKKTHIERCPTAALTYIPNDKMPAALSIVQELMAKKNLQCSETGTIYFQIADTVLYGEPGRVFIAICQNQWQPEEHFYSCYNLYERSYVKNK